MLFMKKFKVVYAPIHAILKIVILNWLSDKTKFLSGISKKICK